MTDRFFAILDLMAEKRLARAGQHAIPLILDIIDSTFYLYGEILEPEELAPREITAKQVVGWLKRGEYRIGFENFMPFGFVGCEAMADCCRLIGPYLYREYLGQEYGKFLLDAGIRWARDRNLSV
ncbi:MAG: hypothetical protein KAT58_06465, partial [candidate division Zixibacteria bacterium]|nr:hypothetical protein [candidate division Zixibacteria bacterium]